jgi:hypothetical protein
MTTIEAAGPISSPLARRIWDIAETGARANADGEVSQALLLDCAAWDGKDMAWADKARKEKIPVMLVNAGEGMVIPGCVLTIPADASLLFFEDDYTILRVLGDVEREQAGARDMADSEEELAASLIRAASPNELAGLREGMASYEADIENKLPFDTYLLQKIELKSASPGGDIVASVVLEAAMFISEVEKGTPVKNTELLDKFFRLVVLPESPEKNAECNALCTKFSANKRQDEPAGRGYYLNEARYTASFDPNHMSYEESMPLDYNDQSPFKGEYTREVLISRTKYPRYCTSSVGRKMQFNCDGFRFETAKKEGCIGFRARLSKAKDGEENLFALKNKNYEVVSPPELAWGPFSPQWEILFKIEPEVKESKLTFLAFVEAIYATITGAVLNVRSDCWRMEYPFTLSWDQLEKKASTPKKQFRAQ